MADSLEGRIAAEHERLQPLFAAAHRALSGDAASPALSALAELRRELETHTAQEDRLYYPALWSLCPEHQTRLRRFIQEHERFRSRLAEITHFVTEHQLAAASDAFSTFARSFATHEVYEEELLRSIDHSDPWAEGGHGAPPETARPT